MRRRRRRDFFGSYYKGKSRMRRRRRRKIALFKDLFFKAFKHFSSVKKSLLFKEFENEKKTSE